MISEKIINYQHKNIDLYLYIYFFVKKYIFYVKINRLNIGNHD